MPSPSTALSTARVHGVRVVAPEAGHARSRAGPATCRACRTSTRGPAGSAGAGANAGIVPLPVPNAAVARPTASSCSRSPATATTVFAGRYTARQKSRIAARRQRADAGLVAADLAAQRPVAEQRLLDQHLAVLGRVVEVGADLLDDDRPLLVDVGVVQPRPDDELAQARPSPARPRGAGPGPSRRSTRGPWPRSRSRRRPRPPREIARLDG